MVGTRVHVRQHLAMWEIPCFSSDGFCINPRILIEPKAVRNSAIIRILVGFSDSSQAIWIHLGTYSRGVLKALSILCHKRSIGSLTKGAGGETSMGSLEISRPAPSPRSEKSSGIKRLGCGSCKPDLGRERIDPSMGCAMLW